MNNNNNNVTNVDFTNKRVKHFKEEPKVTKDAVAEAIDTLYTFIKEDYEKKAKDYTAAEQIVLHEIEDGEDEYLLAHAQDILMNLKDIRNTRREAKQNQEVKEKILKCVKQPTINNLQNTIVTKGKENWGSSKQYYEGKVKRCNTDEDFLSKGLFENMLSLKENKEDTMEI